MGRVQHKTTRKGSHKMRVRTHDINMLVKHPDVFAWLRAVEYHHAMAGEKVIALEMGTEPYNVNHIMEA